MNIHIQVFWHVFISFRWVSRSDITESDDTCMFNFLRRCWTEQSDRAMLHSHQQEEFLWLHTCCKTWSCKYILNELFYFTCTFLEFLLLSPSPSPFFQLSSLSRLLSPFPFFLPFSLSFYLSICLFLSPGRHAHTLMTWKPGVALVCLLLSSSCPSTSWLTPQSGSGPLLDTAHLPC